MDFNPGLSAPMMIDERKPTMRGVLHLFAFIFTCVLAAAYIIVGVVNGWSFGAEVYIVTQLILFGVSSVYHRINWCSTRLRRFFQRLDHASIFLQISGTQTSAVLLSPPLTDTTKRFLITTWVISAVGILKSFLVSKAYETFDVVTYILHGLSIIPFMKDLSKQITYFDMVFFIIGAVMYIIGGITFASHAPDPYPLTFGYHEVFHLFTLIGNTCYMIPIAKKFIHNVGGGES